MGKTLMRAAILILGSGVLALTAAGGASALAAPGGSACQQVQSTLSSIQATLPSAASNPSALKTKIGAFASKLQREASSGSPGVQSAVGTFITDLRAVASGKVNVAKLKADANAIGAACQSQGAPPSGAPGTGGGSTAGLQDPALFAVGGAAVLIGLGALGLARRNQRRNSVRAAHSRR